MTKQNEQFIIFKCYKENGVSQVAPVVKNLSTNAGNVRDVGLIPVSGRSPEKEMPEPTQYSYLENPMDRGAWQATVHGLQ